MAYFAELDSSNKVIRVISVDNFTCMDRTGVEIIDLGAEFCKSLFGQDTVWKQTSYNAKFRKNYAAEGFTYDEGLDAFIPPKPYPSWVLNTETCLWEAPVPPPDQGSPWRWDEDTLSWVPADV